MVVPLNRGSPQHYNTPQKGIPKFAQKHMPCALGPSPRMESRAHKELCRTPGLVQGLGFRSLGFRVQSLGLRI